MHLHIWCMCALCVHVRTCAHLLRKGVQPLHIRISRSQAACTILGTLTRRVPKACIDGNVWKCTCMYALAYMHLHICTCIYALAYMHLHVSTCIYALVCMCALVRTYCAKVCMNIRLYVYVRTYCVKVCSYSSNSWDSLPWDRWLARATCPRLCFRAAIAQIAWTPFPGTGGSREPPVPDCVFEQL